MNNIKDKIKELKWDEKYFYIYCYKNNLRIKIVCGELNIIIKNTENDYIPYYELNIDDIINIYYDKKNDNFIEPKNIILNTKYCFYDNSDDENL